jgi:hypothetical protein
MPSHLLAAKASRWVVKPSTALKNNSQRRRVRGCPVRGAQIMMTPFRPIASMKARE